MKDLLREYLTPKDDGRGFTEAVLLRAAGALHRRARAALETAEAPVLGWLERWARPWVIAALVGLTMAAIVPAFPSGGAPRSGAHAISTDAVTALMPEEIAATFAGGN